MSQEINYRGWVVYNKLNIDIVQWFNNKCKLNIDIVQWFNNKDKLNIDIIQIVDMVVFF